MEQGWGTWNHKPEWEILETASIFTVISVILAGLGEEKLGCPLSISCYQTSEHKGILYGSVQDSRNRDKTDLTCLLLVASALPRAAQPCRDPLFGLWRTHNCDCPSSMDAGGSAMEQGMMVADFIPGNPTWFTSQLCLGRISIPLSLCSQPWNVLR